MTTEFQVTGHDLELNRVVAEVLDVMFSTSTERVNREVPGIESYAATVAFVGDWSGALMVRCGPPTAQSLARRLFKLQEVSADDVADAMGELANMIGGNLKSVLPPGVTLSVPNVARGGDFAVSIYGGRDKNSTLYSCEAGDFEVTLVCLPAA